VLSALQSSPLPTYGSRLLPISADVMDGLDAMSTGSRSSFDLSQASARSWSSRRRSVRILIGVTALLAVVGVMLVVTTRWGPLINGSLSFYQTFDAMVLLVIVVGGLVGSYWLIAIQWPSATALRVDDTGFELTYRRRRRIYRSWSDPNLELELIDYSGVNPTALTVPEFPYSVRLGWAESLLTREAFDVMTGQIQGRQLVEVVARGSTWRYSAEASPLVHHISSNASRAREPGGN
jgi:MFS superfamily sulfate permease-like transporter